MARRRTVDEGRYSLHLLNSGEWVRIGDDLLFPQAFQLAQQLHQYFDHEVLLHKNGVLTGAWGSEAERTLGERVDGMAEVFISE